MAVLASMLFVVRRRGWFASPAPPAPDVFLVSIDTLRADRLGCYGHATARTPFLDQLARAGIRFERAFSTVPITLPAHATLLTGLIPPRHGLRDNGAYRLPDNVPTLAEQFKKAGYQTGAFIGGEPLSRAGGLARGFDEYDDRIGAHLLSDKAAAHRAERPAEEVLASADRWASAARRDTPLFAFIHLYDPHAPYEQSLAAGAAPSYDGEIAHVDRCLASFFTGRDRAGRARPRIVLVTADHGEALGEHGEQTHCTFVYDATLRVPMLLHAPGVAPRVSTEPVSLVDAAPTLLAVAGLPPLSGIDGQSLLPAARGEPVATRDLYFESLFGQLRFGWAPLRGMRRNDLKYIDAPRAELFDTRADPAELNNLLSAQRDVAEKLSGPLRAIGEGRIARAARDRQQESKLAQLGYLGGGASSAPVDAPRPDPKDRIGDYEQFQKAHTEYLAGRVAEALNIMQQAEQGMRNSSYYYLEWGNFAGGAKQWPLAADCYRKCLAIDTTHRDARLNLGTALQSLGQSREAAEQFDILVRQYPEDAEGHLYAGVIRGKYLNDAAAARTHWEKFLQLAPNDPRAAEIRRALGR